MKLSIGERGMRILFITRKFPPSVGGMENMAYHLYTNFLKTVDVELIEWGRSQKWLPLVLPYFLLKSFWILFTKKIDVVHIGDCLLSPLGLVLRYIFKKPITITVYGLDVIYKNRFYQFLIPRCLKRLDKIICISNATKVECVKREVSEDIITVIPVGISDEFCINEDKEILKSKLEKRVNLKLEDKKVLLSVGRLVERKGFLWFIENVVPKLLKQKNDFVYLIAGDGLFRERIENAAANNGLEEYVIMLGKVDDETLKLLYNASDIFIMPNIPVEEDMEGFGIVILEAASCSVPVVASELEGIKDAVRDEENGFLVEPYDVNGFVEIITKLTKDEKAREEFGQKGRKVVEEQFSWDKIANRYLKEFEKYCR